MIDTSKLARDAVEKGGIPIAPESSMNTSVPLTPTENKIDGVAAAKITGTHPKASGGRGVMSMAREALGSHIDNTEKRLRSELSAIEGKQETVTQLHSLIETLNNASGEDGTVKTLDQVADDAELMQEDRTHPTAEGQKQVLENIWPYLLPLTSK